MSELLLPVGNFEMCQAAVHGGADAVYIGMPYFNARGRTKDFEIDELSQMIQFCHLHGVEVHIAFNILIFEDEIPRAIDLLKAVIALGPDAFIVQDLGLATIIKSMASQMPIHASTQMTVTNHNAIHFLEDLGFSRFVLGREVSLSEMKIIRENTSKELEVFVHGALCVAYSGQCFTSEGIGGRSANRGQCAQSCRLDYGLYVDSELKELDSKKYLVSPQDLCGIDHIPELLKIGIDSFKVEGRLKSAEYVATAAQSYRNSIDKMLTSDELEKSKSKMARTYSRGFFSGWLNGVDHQQLVDASFSANRGEFVALVRETRQGKLITDTSTKLDVGQGIVICWNEGAKKIEKGARLSKVYHQENISVLEFWGDIDLNSVPKDARIYINSDPAIESEVKKLISDKSKHRKLKINISIKIEKARLFIEVSDGRTIYCYEHGELLEIGQKRFLSRESTLSEFEKLSSTPYLIGSFLFNSDNDYFLADKALKKIRQLVMSEFTQLRLKKNKYGIKDFFPHAKNSTSVEKNKPQLNIVIRNKEQAGWLASYVQCSEFKFLGDVTLDFEFGRDYQDSYSLLKEQGLTVGIATTRILKPKEYYNLNYLKRIKPDFILCRNLGVIDYLADSDIRLHGDFSLNISNSYSHRYLSSKGVSRICLSYDLNSKQLKDLLLNCDVSNVEVTLHQYMPLFHMEHCVFAAFLSTGSSFKDCGKPCEKHSVELRDAYGNQHFLKADQECRNTMFSGKAQSAAQNFEELSQLGVSHYRLEFLNEEEDLFINKLQSYQQLLLGADDVSSLWKSLNLSEQYGLGEGSLAQKYYQDKKK